MPPKAITMASTHPQVTAWRMARSRIFEHSAHMTMYEEPEAFEQVVRQFLRDADSGSRAR